MIWSPRSVLLKELKGGRIWITHKGEERAKEEKTEEGGR